MHGKADEWHSEVISSCHCMATILAVGRHTKRVNNRWWCVDTLTLSGGVGGAEGGQRSPIAGSLAVNTDDLSAYGPQASEQLRSRG